MAVGQAERRTSYNIQNSPPLTSDRADTSHQVRRLGLGPGAGDGQDGPALSGRSGGQ